MRYGNVKNVSNLAKASSCGRTVIGRMKQRIQAVSKPCIGTIGEEAKDGAESWAQVL
jgi:hypothetical protein